jgi:hypothetical protein
MTRDYFFVLGDLVVIANSIFPALDQVPLVLITCVIRHTRKAVWSSDLKEHLLLMSRSKAPLI